MPKKKSTVKTQEAASPKPLPFAKHTGPAKYGNRYFCVRTDDERVYFYADYVEVEYGELVAYSKFPRKPADGTDETHVVYALPAGSWDAFYAASVLDGRPLAIDKRSDITSDYDKFKIRRA